MTRLIIRELAEQQGLDAAKLARRADLASGTVYALWNDPHKDTSISTLTKIARALGVRVGDLVAEDDETNRLAGYADHNSKRAA